MLLSLVYSTFLAILNIGLTPNPKLYCKPIPGSPDWPTLSQWQALNISVGGRLLATIPPGAVCHPEQPTYDNVTCAQLQSIWTVSSWHANNPFTTDYNDDTCLPSAGTCEISAYPAYVIAAVNAADVQAGINFAREMGVRLIVKGTGHDWPGRSKGANSSSIHTKNIRGLEITQNDPRAILYGGSASIKIAAGNQWKDIYAEVNKCNLTVVGGGDVNVGIGGWVTNGGHSPISSVYGLGADEVIEMGIVTPDGKLRTINETAYSDLFWALRGGGGSTFAVVISVTMKLYPIMTATIYRFFYNTISDTDTYWSLAAQFHTQLPELSEAGGMGNYYAFPSTPDSNPLSRGRIAGLWIFPHKSKAQVEAIMSPFEQSLTSNPRQDPISISSSSISVPNFLQAWAQNPSQSVGISGRLGSWLLDGPALSNTTTLKHHLETATPSPWFLIGHLVAGPGVRNVTIPGSPNSVLPAWRDAHVHLVLPRTWPPSNKCIKSQITRELRETAMPALKALAPNMGGYINENDPMNLDWKDDYFGGNYERLLMIKRKYDPTGVFWCRPCVGWDEWVVVDGPEDEDRVEWGVGGGGGRLCRKL